MRLDRDEVREEIASAEREIFDDEIQCVVGVLNARDGDVPDLHGDVNAPTARCMRKYVPGR